MGQLDSRFEVTRINLTIAGIQHSEVDAHVYTEQRVVREKLAVQVGPLLVYCYSLSAVTAFTDSWTRALGYGCDILPNHVDPTDPPVRNLLHNVGIILRLLHAPHERDQTVQGIPAKASPSGHPHVRIRIGQLITDAYDLAAIRSTLEAWTTARTAARRLWPTSPIRGEHARDEFDRDHIARTGSLPPSR